MKPFCLLSLLLIPVFALAGCVPARPTPRSTQVIHQPSPTKSLATLTTIPASTLTPTIPDTETSVPTATASASTATPSPTKTARLRTATLSPTITPTDDILATEKVNQAIQPFLKEPMNCDVPCFLGFIPGKTHLSEAKTFFSNLGFTPFESTDRYSPSSGMYFYSISLDSGSGHDFEVTLSSDNDLIEDIVLTPDIPNPKEGSPREWIAYSPETLIKKFGSPSDVTFAVDWQQSITIDMIMYFDTSDLIVEYSGVDLSPKQFCPLTDPFDFVRLWMGHNPPDPPSFEAVSLKMATSLTMDQFAQLMLGDPQKACFTLIADMFP